MRGMRFIHCRTASDKEAAALARKENQSTLRYIDFNDQPREVADILIYLAQRETKNLSVKIANLWSIRHAARPVCWSAPSLCRFSRAESARCAFRAD